MWVLFNFYPFFSKKKKKEEGFCSFELWSHGVGVSSQKEKMKKKIKKEKRKENEGAWGSEESVELMGSFCFVLVCSVKSDVRN